MRLLLLASVAAAVCTAQEMPVTGYFRDNQGALRVLQGLEGAWTAPILVPNGVISAGFDGRTLWYKTAAEIHVRLLGGRTADVPVPPGSALAEFSPDGALAGFRFPEAARMSVWDADTMSLGAFEALRDPGRPLPVYEALGENLLLLRSAEGLFAVKAGSDPVLLPNAESPAFQLFQRNGTVESAVGSTITMPGAAPGESSEARFRIRNPTSTAIVISRLSIDPSVFRTFEQFFPPRIIEPGGFADFAIRFSPVAAGAFASTLYVNDLKVGLSGVSAALPPVEIELASGWRTLQAGETVELGSVLRGEGLRFPLRAAAGSLVQIVGDGFSLQPGDGTGTHAIAFLSGRPGIFSAILDVDGRRFTLRVNVTDYPAPRPSLFFSSAPKTAQQSRVTVRLSEAARASYAATLTLAFTPDSGLPDDPAVAFLPQAVRTLPIRFDAGATESSEIVFQTGTTAGTLAVKVSLGANSDERSIRVLPEPAVLTAARVAAASANAEVLLTGYDTTRSVSRLSFTFYLRNGQIAAPGKIDADVAGNFAGYFKSVTGSAFSLRANFPISGTFTELEGVEVEITNSAGARSTGRLRFE